MDRSDANVVRPACVWAIGGASFAEVEDFFTPLHAQFPNFAVTVYMPPRLAGRPPSSPSWIRWGIYGWAGAPWEVLPWPAEEAEARARRAVEMGYAPIFMPPLWRVLSPDNLLGFRAAGVRIHLRDLTGRIGPKLVREIAGSFDGQVPGLPDPRTSWLFTPQFLSQFNLFLPDTGPLLDDPAKALDLLESRRREESGTTGGPTNDEEADDPQAEQPDRSPGEEG